MYRDKGEYYVVLPDSDYVVIPHNCPVCDLLFRTIDDEYAYKLFLCCERCSNEWAYPNQEKWNEGWRPNQEQIKNSLKLRPTLKVK
jgi:hypothetical protein